eukprot:3771645-Alexandrium_andersonii.AAC.1
MRRRSAHAAAGSVFSRCGWHAVSRPRCSCAWNRRQAWSESSACQPASSMQAAARASSTTA